MNKRQAAITMQGNPLTLLGNELKIGDKIPDFTLTANDLSPKKLSDYSGKVLIISSVPSLDTPVCDTEVRRFNEEATNLNGVQILTISMDLPFAQARWCGAAGIENVVTLSDFNNANFGENYGVLIDEMRLLARAVWVVDKNGIIQYSELVKEVGDEPNYEAALAAAKELI